MKSRVSDVETFARSSDLGVNTTMGRVSRECTCHRRRWKYDAGVVGWATVMLSWAHIARNRSMRAEEWSGPCPS